MQAFIPLIQAHKSFHKLFLISYTMEWLTPPVIQDTSFFSLAIFQCFCNGFVARLKPARTEMIHFCNCSKDIGQTITVRKVPCIVMPQSLKE